MTGVISKIVIKRGLVTVSTEIGFSIFEILSDHNFDIGDEVQWKE